MTRGRANRFSVLTAMLFAVSAPGAFADEPKAAPEVRQPGQPAVLKGRVTNEAGVGLPGARVRVAIPAVDMRNIDPRTPQLIMEARADENGDYRVELPGIAKRTSVSLDAMTPGFRKLWGTLMAGGDFRKVDVEPGATVEAKMALQPARYFSGIVIDEKGGPIPGVEIFAAYVFNRGTGGIEKTESGADGSFEVYNYPMAENAFGDEKRKGRVSFSHPDFIGSVIEDVYALGPDRNRDIRVVLPAGRKITGTVFDVDGKPVHGAMVEAQLEKEGIGGNTRKAALTDAKGGFALRGLGPGPTKLSAYALDIKQKLKMSIDLVVDRDKIDVRLQPIVLPADLKTYDVLGTQLTDVTPALKSAYDLFYDRGALILNPGRDCERLEIGAIEAGNVFWMVSQSRVGSVREFIEGILAQTGGRTAEAYSIRVVYGFKTVEFVGTHTQQLKLTKEDVNALQAVADRIKAESR